MKEDDVAIICPRVDDLVAQHDLVVAGSHVVACEHCQAPVWISPASWALKPARIICVQCWQLAGRPEISPATPAQVAEILATLRRRAP